MRKNNAEFDAVHKQYNRFMHFFCLDRSEEIVKYIPETQSLRVLDIGGGTGLLASRLVNKNHHVTVLDLSEKMLSHIEDTRITKINADFLDYSFQQKYDVIIMSDVLHHLKGHEEVVVKVKKILNHQGIFILHDFEKKHWKTKVLHLFEALFFKHLHYRSIKEVLHLVQTHLYLNKIQVKSNFYILRWTNDENEIVH